MVPTELNVNCSNCNHRPPLLLVFSWLEIRQSSIFDVYLNEGACIKCLCSLQKVLFNQVNLGSSYSLALAEIC